jgi:hypothetical protein
LKDKDNNRITAETIRETLLRVAEPFLI